MKAVVDDAVNQYFRRLRRNGVFEIGHLVVGLIKRERCGTQHYMDCGDLCRGGGCITIIGSLAVRGEFGR